MNLRKPAKEYKQINDEEVEMPTVRQQVLDEQVPGIGLHVVEGTQAGIFAGIFADLENIVQSDLKFLFFGAATFLSIVKTGFNIRNYLRRVNPTAGKGLLLAIGIVSLLAEIFAVTAAFTGALIAAAFIPLIFVSMLATNFLVNTAQMFYHGFKWFRSISGSQEGLKHKALFKGHLRGAVLIAVSAIVIGLLMLTPAFHLAVLATVVVLAVKIIGASLIGLNAAAILYPPLKAAAKFIYSIPVVHRVLSPIVRPIAKVVSAVSQKVSNGFRFLVNGVRSLWTPVTLSLLSPASPRDEVAPLKHIPRIFKNDEALFNKYKTPQQFQSLKRNDIDDLIRKLEASVDQHDNTGPKTILEDLLTQAKDALAADLRSGANSLFNFEYQKRKDKEYALNILSQLMEGSVAVTEDKKSDLKNYMISNVQQLIDHLKRVGKFNNVISSAFATDVNQGKMQKLLVLVDHYKQNARLQPIVRAVTPSPQPTDESTRTSACRRMGGCSMM